MKVFAPILAMLFSFRADALTLEDICPHLSTKAQIVWQAPTNQLPKSFWIYKKLPQVFQATTISNAMVLASFQNKGFPKPSTNRVVIWDDRTEGEPQPPYFEIAPEYGAITYSLGDRAPDSPQEIFKDQAAVERAWDRLAQLGIDRSQLVKTNAASYGVYGVCLPRQIDGIRFYDESEGFSFQQFGSHGKIRYFSLTLPNLEREQESPTASAQQIIACIRALKTPSPPDGEERDYFKRIKNLAKVTKLTITKVTPYYGEGVYGEAPTNNEPSRLVTPIAELEAVADFGNSNAS
ncbi:MAG: hypothetical protein ACLQQ0_11445, partial [Limisphaerales bacterium]